MTVLGAERGVEGLACARPASAADAVDGVMPSVVAEPTSVVEVAEVLRAATAAGMAVVARGAGTKLSWGAPPTRVDVVLSTRRLDRLVEHAAGDLVATVQAGLPLERLQQELAGAGQMLGLDPPEQGATVGGIVAADASGPWRLRYGTVRDLLIGVTVVLSDGTIAKAGGKVVKNVAGYDLAKLLVGSLGTLAVVVEATVRLHPLLTDPQVVRLSATTPGGMGQELRQVMQSSAVPAAVEVAWPPGSDTAEAAPVRLKVAFLPAELPALLEAVDRVGGRLRAQAAVGVGEVSLEGTGPSSIGAALDVLRGVAASVVVLEAPTEAKRQVDVWGPVGDALPLMQRVKQRFDPTGTLSPGRFVGGI